MATDDSAGDADGTDADGSPGELGHVHLKVRDVDRAVEFYTGVLGLSVTERVDGGYAFLSYGDHHHDVALQAAGADAPGPGPGVGLYHAAFEVPDRAALRATAARLRDRGVEYRAVDHGISEALYFPDPSGNGLEVYRDTRAETGRAEWRGRSAPLELGVRSRTDPDAVE